MILILVCVVSIFMLLASLWQLIQFKDYIRFRYDIWKSRRNNKSTH